VKAAALFITLILAFSIPSVAFCAAPAESFTVLPDDVLEARLSDAQMAELLYALSREGEDAADFVVLPEGFEEPAAGLDGTFSLLLVGVDTDGQGITGRSDTMVLAVVNTRERTVRLVSFLRDLYVRIPGHGNNRLNAAYAFGGPELLVKTLSETFGVRPDAYFAVDFGLMARLVDAVGGIEIYVSPEELPPLNGILEYYNYQRGLPEQEGRLEEAGNVLLTGLQAMSFARIRKMDSDFARARRQQAVLRAILSRLGEMDALSLLALVTRFSGEVRTDVTLADALALVREAMPLSGYSLEAMSVPVDGGSRNMMKNGAYFLLPNVRKNTAAIREFLGVSGK
jgi:LCP family protein required for cell wall assembly